MKVKSCLIIILVTAAVLQLTAAPPALATLERAKLVGIEYGGWWVVEVVPNATWVGMDIYISFPLDQSYAAVAKTIHSHGSVAAGALNPHTVDDGIKAALALAAFGFDMIIIDEGLSRGVWDASSFNKLYAQVKAKFPNVNVGMSDYDVQKLTSFLKKKARTDFIAITVYQDLAVGGKKKIDAVSSLGANYKIRSYAWFDFADPIDNGKFAELTNYAISKMNGVWFWQFADINQGGWTGGDWCVKNLPYVKVLINQLHS
jgi:hypothetical protein